MTQFVIVGVILIKMNLNHLVEYILIVSYEHGFLWITITLFSWVIPATLLILYFTKIYCKKQSNEISSLNGKIEDIEKQLTQKDELILDLENRIEKLRETMNDYHIEEIDTNITGAIGMTDFINEEQ